MLDEVNLENVVLECFDLDPNITAEKTTFIAPTTSTLQTPNFSTPCSSQLNSQLSPILKTRKRKFISQNENNMGSSNCFFFFIQLFLLLL